MPGSAPPHSGKNRLPDKRSSPEYNRKAVSTKAETASSTLLSILINQFSFYGTTRFVFLAKYHRKITGVVFGKLYFKGIIPEEARGIGLGRQDISRQHVGRVIIMQVSRTRDRQPVVVCTTSGNREVGSFIRWKVEIELYGVR